MADQTKIEWTDATWNPITGCSVVSPGCTNCYAMKMAARLERMGVERYAGLTKPSKAGAVWTGDMRLVEDALTLPLRRKKPTTYFVNSMSDLFHESVPDAWIDRVFAVMALAPQHTFQVLTKRSARMRAYFARLESQRDGFSGFSAEKNAGARLAIASSDLNWFCDSPGDGGYLLGRWPGWPLPNVWLGISAEDQTRADARVPDLLATPAAARFVSAEPLIGPINFVLRGLPDWDEDWKLDALTGREWASPRDDSEPKPGAPRLDWIITGGESGPGARPMHPQWAREIRDECAAAGVAFFHKQHGAWGSIAFSMSSGQPAHREFRDFQHWVNKASTWVRGGTCIDTKGRILRCGADFMAARDEGSFPVAILWPVGKKAAGRLLDGVEHNGMPEARHVAG